MSARDVIAEELERYTVSPGIRAESVIAALRAAGYAILSPDEMRGIRDEALEEAASQADNYGASPGLPDGKTHAFRKHRARIATAIRSLKGGRDAQ